jgi:hypothetical protein
MTKSITISLPDNDYAHPLYVPGVKRAFIQYDPRSNTLYADYSEDDSESTAVYNGTVTEWSISTELNRGKIEQLLDLIKKHIEQGTLELDDIGFGLELTHNTRNPKLVELQQTADPFYGMDSAGGIYDAYDWVGLGGEEQWYGSRTKEETLSELIDDTDTKLKQWFFDLDHEEEGSDGNRHWCSQTDATIFGLLDYWRDRVDEYRAEKATV